MRNVSIAIFLIGIAIVVFVMDWGFLKGEITAYPLMCDQELEYGVCRGSSVPLNPTTYKVSAEKQQVVFWTGESAPNRTTKCAIRDRRNWQCKYEDESGMFGFVNGEYQAMSLPGDSPLDKKVYHVSRIAYLKAHLH